MREVRLVGEDGSNIVLFDEAIRKAEDMGLDLVMVSDQTKPPVVRIQDFKKIQYEQKKAKAKQHTRSSELKEIQLKVNITDHDLGTKLGAIDKFLARGDKVKITVRLKGRERENPERASQLIQKVVAQVKAKVNMLSGPIAGVLLEPEKTK
jgi:translation initiation factor IF-3